VPLNEPFGLRWEEKAEEEAFELLENRFEAERLLQCHQTEIDTTIPESPPKKLKRDKGSLFECLGEDRTMQRVFSRRQKDEIQEYLSLPNLEETANPLVFWREQENNLPILSRLARRFLAVPAISGSVERVFSIAGALGRARRARIEINNTEDILLYREARISQLFS
jgi:hAT family C-terminal dimerisation region